MLKVDNKKEQIEIVGGIDVLKDEIGTIMLAICGEISKFSKSAAEDMFNHIVKSVACVAVYLETKRDVKLKGFHDDEGEEEMDDVLKALDELEKAINKKKGDE